MNITLLAALSVVSANVTSEPSPAPCSLSTADQAWVDKSVAAWNYTSEHITGIGHGQAIQAVFFDTRCVVTSATAMNARAAQWTGTRHAGKVRIPGGPEIQAGVTSFAMGGEGRNLFVMSTPSVWRAANKSDNGLGRLETLMTHVVLHEGTHVAQIPTYGRRMEKLAKTYGLPDDFNDDSIQERFESEAAFASSVAEETALWIAAANAKDRDDALASARAALAKMRARQKRWYSGRDEYLTAAEDIWLTMEGSAQWAGYAWLVDAKGANLPRAVVVRSFTKGKWWSQVEGFAMFLALDRLTGGSWRAHAFGNGSKTLIEMLDGATYVRTPREAS